MKKYLFLLSLFVLILLPKNVFAFVIPPNDYLNYYSYPVGITKEDKQFILDSVKNDSDYLSYSEMYPYQIIIYKTGKIPYQYTYSGHYALVIYFNEIPSITNTFDQYMTIEPSVQAKVVSYLFDLDNRTYSLHNRSFTTGTLKFFYNDSTYHLDVGEYGSYLASYLDFFLYSNFNLKPLWNFNLYDLDNNLIKTYTTEDDLFNFEKEAPKIFEAKIYVPDLYNFKCFVVRDSDVIRAYREIPTQNSTVEYRDYYYNSGYYYNDSTQTFSQYSTLPTCLSKDSLTDKYSYRTDFADICIISIILIGSVWFLISMLVKVLFKGKKLY